MGIEAGIMSGKSATSTKTRMEKGENISQPDKWFSIKWNKLGHYILYGRWNMAFYFCLKDVIHFTLRPSKNRKAEQAVASLKRCISIRGAKI
ncbi:MAG: hypothetical protein IPO33_02075 [Saprospiraceae bacterium]|nr:hypothetical protein [Candidatus Brachybacter algidus]